MPDLPDRHSPGRTFDTYDGFTGSNPVTRINDMDYEKPASVVCKTGIEKRVVQLDNHFDESTDAHFDESERRSFYKDIFIKACLIAYHDDV